MFKYVIGFLLLPIALSFFCVTHSLADVLSANEQVQIEALKNTALNSELSYQIVESLTTEVGHRLMGSEGDKNAIKWAIAKMHSLGFDKVWTEEISGPKWIRGEASARITSPFPQEVVVIALGGSVGTGEKGIEAPVVHFKTFADLKKAPEGSLLGKIAFVSYQMTRHIDGDGYGAAVGTRVAGASVAAEKGAIALIMRSVGTDNNRIAHTGVMRYKDKVKKIPAAALSNPDADLLVNQFSRGKPVSFYLRMTSSNPHGETVKSANVIGEITGSEFPNEIVAIGAHLDSWDVGTGALDDGIGVAMVLASAHYIAQLPKRPKKTLRVILFAAEEVGLLGAKAYIKKHETKMVNHVIGAEWDFGLGRIYKMTPGVGASSLNGIRELAQVLAPMGVALAPTNKARAQSDMSLLSDAGMPSINFSPDGSQYFDYHHTENDTLDKVDALALKQNTAVYTVFAYFSTQANINFRK